jgi:dephospho-CoA kinase
LICLVGLPGSGKSTVASVLQDYGLPVVVMGDAVRMEAKARGVKPSLRNMRELMLQLRRERGEAAVADLCLPLIEGTGSATVIIDGVRSLAEVQRFGGLAHVRLIGVFSPRYLRFQRLKTRHRRDAPRSLKDLALRDMTEVDVGLGDAFALSDLLIINDGPLRSLRLSVERMYRMMR